MSKITVQYIALRKTSSETTNPMEFQLSLKKLHGVPVCPVLQNVVKEVCEHQAILILNEKNHLNFTYLFFYDTYFANF